MTRSSNFRNIENDDNESLEHDFANARLEPEGNSPNNVISSAGHHCTGDTCDTCGCSGGLSASAVCLHSVSAMVVFQMK